MNATQPATPREHRIEVNGAELAWFEWNEPGDEVILLVHATGFHGRCWDRVVDHLGGRWTIALEMRGHGRSAKTPPYSWDTFGDDLAAFVDALDLRGVVGVGHSMGGHSVTQAAALRPQRFRRLVLVDPVILDPRTYAARGRLGAAEDHPTSRRRGAWRSWREMYERFADRPPFSQWDPRVLEDYCRHGVLRDPAVAEGEEGAWRLACPPLVEASIYQGSADSDIYAMIERVEIPVTVLRARGPNGERDVMDFSVSPTWPGLAEHFPNGRDVYLPERSHFLPMEDPALVADYVLGRR